MILSRKVRLLSPLLIGALLSAGIANGQSNTTVSVGAVTRDSGLYVGPSDVSAMKDVNKFLSSLESDLAGEVSSEGIVEYLDRSSVRELFRELHLSSSFAFDASSGASRGLLGRLDLLVVIDALEPDKAKMRLIDVETGAVRGVESCTKRFALLGLSTQQAPDCVPAMARRISTVGKQKIVEKADRIAKNAQQKLDDDRTRNERAKTAEQQRAAADARLAHRAQIARAEDDKARLAAENEERLAASQKATAMQAVLQVKPNWDDAVSRLSAARQLWFGIQQQMAGSGQSLRPEIQSLLKSANADITTGNSALDGSDAETLKQVTASLNAKLDKLDRYR
jgi:hypothetical protein